MVPSSADDKRGNGGEMPSKRIPLSVRISQDDAAFLANLTIAGVTTPSDKLRELIRQARQRHVGFGNYATCLAFHQEMMAPFIRGLREAENVSGQHSELLVELSDWLPEMAAFLISGLPSQGDEDAADGLATLESGAADRVVRLMSAVLRMAVTAEDPCYDPKAVSGRLDSVLELCQIIHSKSTTTGEQ